MPDSQTIDAVDTLAERLADVRARIAAACRRAGRSPEAVTLVGVTKTFSLEVVQAAREAGLRDFGENRVQEFVEKATALPGEVEGGPVRWHLIGHLQRNKAKDAVVHADLFHALDSPRLADVLDRHAEEVGRVMPCLVQVNVSGEASKFGLEPDVLYPFLDHAAGYSNLRIEGLMTLAAPTDDAETVRPQFWLLRTLAEGYASDSRIRLRHLSMGMSGDFEVAVEEGATLVRVGSALFGARN